MIKYIFKHNKTTSCLWNHYNFIHKLDNGVDSVPYTSIDTTMEIDDLECVPTRPLKKQRASLVSVSANIRTNINKKRQELITQALTKMITEYLLPISFVENGGFKNLKRVLEPEHVIPCRKTVTKRIEGFYDKVTEAKKSLADASDVTTDGWTSSASHSDMTIAGIL